MTCSCDADTLPVLEAFLAANISNANAIRAAVAGLPAICSIIPYHTGATDDQKKCQVRAALSMLAKWFYCINQQDPNACFAGVCDDYADAVDACYTA